jgi:hypothetical protein
MNIKLSVCARYLLLILACFSITTNTAAQHVEEIRKALYPKFNVALFETNLSQQEREFEPYDLEEMDLAPRAHHYLEVFEGYYILFYFYKKRSREMLVGLDSAAKRKVSLKNRADLEKIHSTCNKIWNPQENGYTEMTWRYMNCLTNELKRKVDAIGGGMAGNALLDKNPEIGRFRIGAPLSSFADAAQGKNPSYYNLEDTVLSNVPARIKLRFSGGNVDYIEMEFQCCPSVVLKHLNETFGRWNLSSSEPVATYDYYLWKGSHHKLEAVYLGEFSGLTVYISKR